MKTRTVLIASAFTVLTTMAMGHVRPDRDPFPKEETIIRAKASGKMILTGSGTFGDRHVAGFLDRNFIVQSDAMDTEGAFLSIYDRNGRLVHRVVNDPTYPYELAAKIKRGLDSETQYYPLLRRFKGGERSADLLRNVIIGADDADDVTNAPRLMQAYVDQLPEVPTESELAFVAAYTRHTGDPGFAYLLQRETQLDKLADIVFRDVFLPQVSNKYLDAGTWLTAVKARYPEALAPAMDRMMVELLERRGDRQALDAFVPGYISRCKDQLNAAQVDYYAGLVSGSSR